MRTLARLWAESNLRVEDLEYARQQPLSVIGLHTKHPDHRDSREQEGVSALRKTKATNERR